MSSPAFDLSDVEPPAHRGPTDLRRVLAVAREVVDHYGDDPQGTRIEVMARWLVGTFDDARHTMQRAGAVSKRIGDPRRIGSATVERCARMIGVTLNGQEPLTPRTARDLAHMLLEAADEVELEG